ncbi:TonB family protein [Candidatus Omnitrophota bacterium]
MKNIFKMHSFTLPKIYLISLFTAIALFFVSVYASHAQEYTSALDSLEEEVVLYIGETKVIPVSNPTRAAIGNPKVADIVSDDLSGDSIPIGGRGAGATILVVWDDSGEHSYKIRVLTANVEDIKRRIDNLLQEIRVDKVYTKANNEEGKVLLLGEVQVEEDKSLINLALGDLVKHTVDLIQIKDEGVIDIEVQVLELTKDATKTLGFTLPGQFQAIESSGPTTDAVTGFDAIFHVSDWTRSALSVTLDFLEQEGQARVLSRPRLACLSGREAELLVGGEKPTFSTAVQTGGASSTSIEYKEYGIKLSIQPTLKEDDNINIALSVEISEIGDAITIGNPNQPSAKAFPLTKRDVSTELILKNGQTLAIGGLLKEKLEDDTRQPMFFGDIPIIGALFRKRETKMGGGQGERGDIELFVTLTPTIVSRGTAIPSEAKKAEETKTTVQKAKADAALEDEEAQELLEAYVCAVHKSIINATYYPEDAESLGWTGTVHLSVLIASNGALLEALIAESSGHQILDEAALEAVKAQDPYPSFPYQLRVDELRIEVPIAYRRDSF